MDPLLVKGLREAKQLLDDGILQPAEFEKEKQVLLQKRDIRVQREAARAREDPERRYRGDGANNTYCSRCGMPGHNKRSCNEDIEALGGKKRRKKGKWDLLGGKRGPPRPRWNREPTCYALFFGAGTAALPPPPPRPPHTHTFAPTYSALGADKVLAAFVFCPRRYALSPPACASLLMYTVRAELKKMKADDAEKKLKISDAAKVVAAKWRLMSDEEKGKWKREKPVVEEGAEGAGGMVGGISGMPGMTPLSGGMPGMTPMSGGMHGGVMMMGVGSVGGVIAPPPSGQPAPPPTDSTMMPAPPR